MKVEYSAEALPPGLKFAENVIREKEEVKLISLIEGSGISRMDCDPGNPRNEKQFGWYYDTPSDKIIPGEPIPEELEKIIKAAARFADIKPEDIEACLLIRYDPGSHIQWHIDKPAWDKVIGLSLGAPVTMDFRKQMEQGFDGGSVLLSPRSMFLLSGEAYHTYQYHIAPVVETRWSIILRSRVDLVH